MRLALLTAAVLAGVIIGAQTAGGSQRSCSTFQCVNAAVAKLAQQQRFDERAIVDVGNQAPTVVAAPAASDSYEIAQLQTQIRDLQEDISAICAGHTLVSSIAQYTPNSVPIIRTVTCNY